GAAGVVEAWEGATVRVGDLPAGKAAGPLRARNLILVPCGVSRIERRPGSTGKSWSSPNPCAAIPRLKAAANSTRANDMRDLPRQTVVRREADRQSKMNRAPAVRPSARA